MCYRKNPSVLPHCLGNKKEFNHNLESILFILVLINRALSSCSALFFFSLFFSLFSSLLYSFPFYHSLLYSSHLIVLNAFVWFSSRSSLAAVDTELSLELLLFIWILVTRVLSSLLCSSITLRID